MSDNDEFIRIHVPHPDTELVLGIRDGNTNFSGIMGRVADGGVFLGAGGYPGGMPSADSNYDGFKKAHTTLNVAIGALGALALHRRSPRGDRRVDQRRRFYWCRRYWRYGRDRSRYFGRARQRIALWR